MTCFLKFGLNILNGEIVFGLSSKKKIVNKFSEKESNLI